MQQYLFPAGLLPCNPPLQGCRYTSLMRQCSGAQVQWASGWQVSPPPPMLMRPSSFLALATISACDSRALLAASAAAYVMCHCFGFRVQWASGWQVSPPMLMGPSSFLALATRSACDKRALCLAASAAACSAALRPVPLPALQMLFRSPDIDKTDTLEEALQSGVGSTPTDISVKHGSSKRDLS